MQFTRSLVIYIGYHVERETYTYRFVFSCRTQVLDGSEQKISV